MKALNSRRLSYWCNDLVTLRSRASVQHYIFWLFFNFVLIEQVFWADLVVTLTAGAAQNEKRPKIIKTSLQKKLKRDMRRSFCRLTLLGFGKPYLFALLLHIVCASDELDYR